MISSTFFQELFTGNIQGDFSFGKGSAKQGGQSQSGFSTVLDRIMNSAEDSSATAAFANKLPKGHRFLEQLKKTIMASGVSLEASQVDADAMAQFRKLLITSGFNKQEVQGMISDLTSGGTGKGVTLATLFAKASQLSKPDETDDASVFLEISTLPYIETILAQLGMDSESIQSVLADAKVEGRGIDIGKLAANIRRAMAADNRLTEAVSDNPNDVLDMMRRIGLLGNDTQHITATLDKVISELSRLNKKKISTADEEASANLLMPYFQQLAASLGDDGDALRQLIDSAGKDDAGFDGEALLAKLVQVRQELSTTTTASVMAGLSGKSGETWKQGEMGLSQFVSALEARISAKQQIQTMLDKEISGRPADGVVGKFFEKITAESDGAREKLAVPAVMGQRPGKEGLTRDVPQTADKSTSGATGKDGPGQNALEAIRQASAGGDTSGNTPENSSDKEEAAKFLDALTSAGKQKVKKSAEQNLSVGDGFVKTTKSADATSAAMTSPTNRTLPGYLLDQVSRQIVKLRTAGESEITLQLKPPHLGRMKLNVEHVSGGIKVGIVVESHAAKEMLLSHANELKAALGDQGLRLDKIDVEAQSDFGRSMAQAGREFGQSGSRSGRQTGHAMVGGNTIPDGSVIPETIRGVAAGRLDLVA
jgi:flagellar hook-length control protein FliK